ncbi:MAG: aminodeoxychorismate/anthranilate synthase component II [Nocardioidaceae bacterium]
MTGAGMRTLIIDNYDSFTYNLFHLVAEVTGVPPEVVRNDEPGWTTAELDRFDNVVISPGPGRPERQADFGICADAIRAASRPLLGVCLGHQGLAAVLGGEIGAAPEPVHGRQSQVVHRQVDILAGLPSPFAAVRYHSLLAHHLPEELEAIGWTPDGLVMALRHRHQPMWGVQFHPESVCTEHGHHIMRNFAELTRRWHAARADSEPAARTAFMVGRTTPELRTPHPELPAPPAKLPAPPPRRTPGPSQPTGHLGGCGSRTAR